MKNAQAIYKESVEAIEEIYGQNEAEQLINIAFEDALGISKLDRLTKNTVLNISALDTLKNICHRLINQEPIQQIVGKAQFYGLEFLINEHCLIPRPETEELVSMILKNIDGPAQLLDIGTGSGCIPIALKKNMPELTVSAIDVSAEALDIARKNADALNTSIKFSIQDILSQKLDEDYDIIVSNPPYIPYADKLQMSRNVLAFEPEIALFVPNENPLLFYKRIGELGLAHLKPNGILYFEIHESYGKGVVDLLHSLGYTQTDIFQDLNGKDRMVIAGF